MYSFVHNMELKEKESSIKNIHISTFSNFPAVSFSSYKYLLSFSDTNLSRYEHLKNIPHEPFFASVKGRRMMILWHKFVARDYERKEKMYFKYFCMSL